MNEERKHYDDELAEEQQLISRREYLLSLKKWSKVVIGAVVFGTAATRGAKDAGAAAWINNRGNWGNGWKNGGGGSVWVNNRGGSGLWSNGSGGWGNGSGSWRNGSGGWNDRGGSWRNNSGGWNDRGGSWVNRRN